VVLIEGTKFINDIFANFGLTVHLGMKETETTKKEKTKTEALFIPARSNKSPNSSSTMDFDVGEDHFVSFCGSFCYLGTTITPDLDDTHEIERRIRLGRDSFQKKRSLKKPQDQSQAPRIALSGCETWALKDIHKQCRFHHDCARSIYGITPANTKESRWRLS
jgi:hypothetical protein